MNAIRSTEPPSHAAADAAVRMRQVCDALARDSLPIVACSAFVGLVAVLSPHLLSSDGWLALVGGRYIREHGLPHHDSLAALTAGRPWVDQQWLGQLGAYEVNAVGGVRLLLAANVVLVAGALVAATIYARRRGAAPTTVAAVGLLVLLPFLVTAMNVRTQSCAYLGLVSLVALLTTPEEIGLPRAAVALSLLVLWANVHGSVLLAAAMVVLRGIVNVARRRSDYVAWLLIAAPGVCVLASPYNVHLVGYYADTVLNRSFAAYLSQWAPTSFSAISAPLLLVVFAVPFVLARAVGAYSPYERCLLALAALVGLLAVRNWPFAALLLLMLLPIGLDRGFRKRPPRPAPGLGAAIAAVAGIAAVWGVVVALSHPASALTSDYPEGAADAAARIADATHGRVYAGIGFGDWLLWTHPELTGRIVFDVRYELLRRDEMKRLVLFDDGSGLDNPLGAPTVFVLDPVAEKEAVLGLSRDVRTVYKTDRAFVGIARTRP